MRSFPLPSRRVCALLCVASLGADVAFGRTAAIARDGGDAADAALAVVRNTMLRGPDGAFLVDVVGAWTPLEPDAVARARGVVTAARSSDPALAATLSVLRMPDGAEESAWQRTLGRHENASALADRPLRSAAGETGWVWQHTQGETIEVLASVPGTGGEFAVHLEAAVTYPVPVLVVTQAVATFRRFDRAPMAALAGVPLSVAQHRSVHSALSMAQAPAARSLAEDRGIVLHHASRSGRAADEDIDAVVRRVEGMLRALDQECAGIAHDRTRERALVIQWFGDRRAFGVYANASLTDGTWNPAHQEVVVHGNADAALDALAGLLWAWRVDTGFAEPPLPAWVRHGHVEAWRLRARATGQTAIAPLDVVRASVRPLESAQRLPRVRDLLRAPMQAFATSTEHRLAAASLVCYLRAGAAGHPALAARVGEALRAALESRDAQCFADVFAHVDLDELDRNWRAWIWQP